MYHLIVRIRLRRAFAAINQGDYSTVVAQFATHHRHLMYGRHALAGERNSHASTAQWYARLQRLLPGLRFDVRSMAVTGWPWHTVATVTWHDRFNLPDGSSGTNVGVHEFVLRWGRVYMLAVHCDTERLAAYCRQMAQSGLAEAAAAPITDVPLD